MDTSKEYIEMCSKATEIQEVCKRERMSYGDMYHFKKGILKKDIVTYVGDDYGHFAREIYKKDYTWLPRQEQLQEMIWTNTAGTYNLLATKLFAFSDYWEENGIPKEFTSMEQLWLAFFMAEKYNKIWDGKDWVNV